MGTLGLKSRLLEQAIKRDLIPAGTKWMQAVSAVGSMDRNMFYLLGPEDRGRLSGMMEEMGLEHSREILHRIGATRDLHGCALAVMAYHRVFGIKSAIAEETGDEVVIHVTRCAWKDKRGWTPEICASIQAFENGLVKGIDASIRHRYTMRRSLGDPVCEIRLSHTG